jgi:hypothetical protein
LLENLVGCSRMEGVPEWNLPEETDGIRLTWWVATDHVSWKFAAATTLLVISVG